MNSLQDKWNHNYCRNSGGVDDIPICYIDESNFDECEIPRCEPISNPGKELALFDI